MPKKAKSIFRSAGELVGTVAHEIAEGKDKLVNAVTTEVAVIKKVVKKKLAKKKALKKKSTPKKKTAKKAKKATKRIKKSKPKRAAKMQRL